MKILSRRITIALLFLNGFAATVGLAQTKEADSLLSVYRSTQADSIKIDALNTLVWPVYSNSLPDSGIKYGLLAIQMAERNNYLPKLVVAYRRTAICYTTIANYKMALYYHEASLSLAQKLNSKKDIGIALGNIGVIYLNVGDYTRALDYNLKSISLKEKAGELASIHSNYYNVGLIYKNIDDFENAMLFMNKSIEFAERAGKYKDMGVGYSGIGMIYKSKKQFVLAKKYFLKSIESNLKYNSDYDLCESYINMGSLYAEMRLYDSAFYYFDKSLIFAQRINYSASVANAYSNIAICFLLQKKFEKAIEFANRSLAVNNNNINNQEFSYSIISDANKYLGHYKTALEFLEKRKILLDSISNINKNRDLIKLQLQYDYDKKAAQDSIKNSDQQKIISAKIDAANAKLKQEKTFRVALLLGLVGLIIFLYVIYTRLQLIKRKNEIIQRQKKEADFQKHLIEVKQKEIIDSINYAKRIQGALLASDEQLHQALSQGTNSDNFFIFFKPKDIVSGDFYWSTTLQNGHFALVTADSTGHGVPGAFMSLLNISFLNDAVKERHITNTAEILNYARERIIESLAKDGSRDGGKDGMDCTLLSIDYSKMLLHFSCANNPIWICRDGELTKLDMDRMPVGKHSKDNVSFKAFQFKLKKHDIIYTATDGYADQFGGPDGKKFKYKPLAALLLQNSDLPMKTQKAELNKHFEAWKGDLEQVDDVCMVGIRV